MRPPYRRLLLALLASSMLAVLPWSAGAQRAGVTAASGLRFTALAAGRDFTCGLAGDGRAWCWGANYHGQLGHDAADATCSDAAIEEGACASTPMPVVGDLRFTQLVAGEHHACGLTAEGAAWCWGADDRGQLGPGEPARECLVRRREFPGIPAQPCSPEPVRVPSTQGFTTIAAADEATCALDDSGQVWCWGGLTNDVEQPDRLDLSETFVNLYAAGTDDLCGVTKDFALRCWRRSAYSYEGVDAPVTGLAVATVAMGPFHACALDRGGRAYCWGSNESGQSGRGSASKHRQVNAAAVAAGRRFRTIAAADERTCAVETTGALYCWGWIPEITQRNVCVHRDYDASTTRPRGCSMRPRRVISDVRVMAIALGPTHRCALSTNGIASCWGSNAWGALGDGTFEDADVPPLDGGLPTSRAEIIAGEVQRTISQLLVRGCVAILVLGALFVRVRPRMAGLTRQHILRIWGYALAAHLAIRVVLWLVGQWTFGGVVDGLAFQPFMIAAGITLYWLVSKPKVDGSTTPAAHLPVRSTPSPGGSQRHASLALAAVVVGWLPMLYLFLSPAPFEGLSGELGLGMAAMMFVGAAVMMAAGAATAVVLGVKVRRQAHGTLVVDAAIALGALTGLALAGAMLWVRYYT